MNAAKTSVKLGSLNIFPTTYTAIICQMMMNAATVARGIRIFR
jgi:hypothetical protein